MKLLFTIFCQLTCFYFSIAQDTIDKVFIDPLICSNI